MRNRDYHNFEQGAQNINKLIAVQFIGWQIRKSTNQRITYNPHECSSEIQTQFLNQDNELILWYELYGTNRPVYNKFPMKPSKKLNETQGKLMTQLELYADISELKAGHYYAVWQHNADKKTYGTDKAGYWYWTDLVEVPDKWSINEITSFKTSLRFKDRDYPHPKELISYVSALGRIDGPALYEHIHSMFGEKPSVNEERIALIDYVAKTEVLSPRTEAFIRLLHRMGMLDKYIK